MLDVVYLKTAVAHAPPSVGGVIHQSVLKPAMGTSIKTIISALVFCQRSGALLRRKIVSHLLGNALHAAAG